MCAGGASADEQLCKAIASAVMSRRSLGRGQPFNEHAARADGADHQLMSDANGSPPPNENLKAGTLRCALDVFHREAFLLRELQPAAAGGRGRSAKPLRLDLGEDSELPLVDWDEAVVGQGAKVLTGNHIWLDAVVIDTWRVQSGRLTHTLRLLNGDGDMQQVLPDHRVALQVEVKRDNLEAPREPPPRLAANGESPPPTARDVDESPGVEGGSSEGAIAGATDDERAAINAAIVDPGTSSKREANEEDMEEPVTPYYSSLSCTGFRHVRVAPALDSTGAVNSAAGTYECAFFVDGREKVLGPFKTAALAAEEYAQFVSDHFAHIAVAAAAAEAKRAAAAARGGKDGGKGLAEVENKRKDEPKPTKEIVYDEKLVGRRVRALMVEDDGEWYLGTVEAYEAPKSRVGKPKYTIKYENDEVEEVTLPDDTIKLLPVQPEGAPAPPLTKEDEKRAYRAQADLEEAAARANIDDEKLHLHMSDKTNTGYRGVHAIKLKLGVISYDAVAHSQGKKVNLGRYKSKLGAAYAFAKFNDSGEHGRAKGDKKGGGDSGGSYGNMLVPVALLDSMDGGTRPTRPCVCVPPLLVPPLMLPRDRLSRSGEIRHHQPDRKSARLSLHRGRDVPRRGSGL